MVEDKPFGVAVHLQELTAVEAHQAIEQLTERARRMPCKVHLRRMGFTLHMSVVRFGHDLLIKPLHQLGSATVLYADNDEVVHAALLAGDIGCAIGAARIGGAIAMPSVREFVEFLRLVGQERSAVAGAVIDVDG